MTEVYTLSPSPPSVTVETTVSAPGSAALQATVSALSSQNPLATKGTGTALASTLTSFGITWPALITDGRTVTKVTTATNGASVTATNWGMLTLTVQSQLSGFHVSEDTTEYAARNGYIKYVRASQSTLPLNPKSLTLTYTLTASNAQESSSASSTPLPSISHTSVNSASTSAPVTALATASLSTGAAVSITITAFPAVGALTPILEVVSGLANPAAFEAVLYVRSGDRVHWWIKPHLGTSAVLDANGAFSFVGWASNPTTDVAVTAFAIAILPIGTAIIPSPRE